MRPDELRQRVTAELGGHRLVVALGGGADSAVAAWSCGIIPGTRAVFVDHGLPASADLRDTAVALAEAVGLPLTVLAAPVEDGPNLEARARAARWQAIRDDLDDRESVVTGHNRDDLAETVVINLLRGAGSAGLAAMAAPRSGVLRPLLDRSRAELREFAETLELPFTDDPANADARYLRSRIRTELIPRLERDYQGGVQANLARAAVHLAGDDAVLDAAADIVPVRDDDGALLLPVAMLETLPPPVSTRAVRRALRSLNPPYAGSAADIEVVFGVRGGGLSSATLTGAVQVAREGPYVAIWREEPQVPEPVGLEPPGSVVFGGVRVSATPARTTDLTPRAALMLDPSVFDAGVTIRAAATGERIDITEGTKLVRDALAEAGVPRRKRPAWPAVANDAKIAAVVGVRVAPWARPGGDAAIVVTREQL